jgi:hypothetical protein
MDSRKPSDGTVGTEWDCERQLRDEIVVEAKWDVGSEPRPSTP